MHPLIESLLEGQRPTLQEIAEGFTPYLQVLSELPSTPQDPEWHGEGDV